MCSSQIVFDVANIFYFSNEKLIADKLLLKKPIFFHFLKK
jgi:hypothetical protein